MKYNQLYQIEGRWTRLYIEKSALGGDVLVLTFKNSQNFDVNYTKKEDIMWWFNLKEKEDHIREISMDELSETHKHEIIEEVFWNE